MNLVSLNYANKLQLLFSWAEISPEVYDIKYRNKVEQLYSENPKPFKSWFGDKEKVVIPFAQKDQTVKAPDKLAEVLKGFGYEITDYIKGYCLNTLYNRQERINNALLKIKRQIVNNPNDNPDTNNAPQGEQIERLIHLFINDPQRASGQQGQLVIVFSQNPHDVFLMSTNKVWTSCLEVEKGQCWEEMFEEVRTGGFVAYLSRIQDINDLDKSLARIWIRGMESVDGKLYAIPETKTKYGNAPDGFLEEVQKWINSHQPVMPVGQYKRKGAMYSDTYKGREKDNFFYLRPEMTEQLHGWGDPEEVHKAMMEVINAYSVTPNPVTDTKNMIKHVIFKSFNMFNTYADICITLARTCPHLLDFKQIEQFDTNQLVYILNNFSESFTQRSGLEQDHGYNIVLWALFRKLITNSIQEQEFIEVYKMITNENSRRLFLEKLQEKSWSNESLFKLYSKLKKTPVPTLQMATIHKLNNPMRLELNRIFSSQL